MMERSTQEVESAQQHHAPFAVFLGKTQGILFM